MPLPRPRGGFRPHRLGSSLAWEADDSTERETERFLMAVHIPGSVRVDRNSVPKPVLITYQAHLAPAGHRKLGFRRPRNQFPGRLAVDFSVSAEPSRTIAFRVRGEDELGT